MPDHQPGDFDLWQPGAARVPARELAALLELRAQDPDQVAARATYLDLIEVGPGARVLDVGCGSGAVTRDMARRVWPQGRAVGLDPNAEFLTIARELAGNARLTQALDLSLGDARRLPFADAAFDVAVAVTALAHTPGAEAAIPEMVRVVRPGGRVGIFDLDGDGVILAHPDRQLARRIVAAAVDRMIVNSWLVRQLPALLAAAGLQSIGVRAFSPVERDPAGVYARLAEQRAAIAVQVGAISAAEHRRWLDTLHAEQEAGRFLGGQTHLFVWGTRPAEELA